MRTLVAALLLASVCIANVVEAAEHGPVALQPGVPSLVLGPHASELRDPQGRLQIQDILQVSTAARFRPATRQIVNHGLTTDAYWYRLSLRNDPGSAALRDWVLEVGYPVLDWIDLHIVRTDGSIQVIRTGDRRLASPELIEHRNFAIPVRVDPGERIDLYLRVQTQGSHQVPLTLWSSEEFLRKTGRENFWFGLYYGILAAMALYNLFIFLSVRDPAYVYYILYIATASSLYLILNGFGRHIWGGWPALHNILSGLFISLPAIFSALFSRAFLQTRQHSVGLHRTLNGLLAFSVLCAGLVLFAPYSVHLRMNTLLTMVSTLVLITVGLISLLKGVRTARFYLLAWSVFFVGVMLRALEVAGVIPTSFLTNYSVQIGTGFDVSLLSLALADRINTERREKLKAQAEARHARELEKWNQTLEERVRAQVEQLQGLSRLKNYFPPQVAELILAEGGDSLLQPRRRNVTVCVIDMRGFTAFAESAEPEEIMGVLRQYYAAMGAVVDRYQGTVESFAGDGMTIFFNAPVDIDKPEEHAVRMAFEMREAFEVLRAEWALKNHHLGLGIGLASGYATAGTIGFTKRWQYAAIGIVTNIAARLCAVAAHGEILATARLHAAVQPLVLAEELEEKPIRGLRQPVPTVRLLRLADEAPGFDPLEMPPARASRA